MTNQEAFDAMVRHLAKQGERCTSGELGDDCCYRGPNGLKCAVGALIPDEEYSPDFEDSTADVSAVALACPTLNGIDVDMLGHAQFVHDVSEVHNWRRGMRSVADIHGLDDRVVHLTDWSACEVGND